MEKYKTISLTIVVLIVLVFISTSAFPNQVRMVAIGDSITFGTGDPQSLGYIGRFTKKYNEANGHSVKLSNFGIPRYTTDDILQQLKKEQIRRSINTAHYIVLYIGTNDFRVCADYKFSKLKMKDMNRGKQKFSNNLHQILTNIRTENKSAPIVVMGMYHPYTQYHNEKEIYGVIREWNKEINRTVSQFNETTFVPTADLFLEKPKQSCFSDSLHLNGYGYELMANRLFESMDRLGLE